MLCDLRGRFLFEVLPDLFPAGRLTDVEVGLWGLYYDAKSQESKHR
jgi:hypothetical protein